VLECGARIDVENDNRRTPVHEAAESGSAQTICLFSELGAAMDAASLEGTPLEVATASGHVDIARELCLIQCCQDHARRGEAGELRACIVSGGHVPAPVQWLGRMPAPAFTELSGWAATAVRDASACYAALFGPLDPAYCVHPLRAAVAHDGLSHVQGLIVACLVHKRAATRKALHDVHRAACAMGQGGPTGSPVVSPWN